MDAIHQRISDIESQVYKKKIPWREKVSLFEELHNCLCTLDQAWTQEKTAERTGFSISMISIILTVARELNNPVIKDAIGINPAYRTLVKEKKKSISKSSRGLIRMRQLDDMIDKLSRG